SALFPYTTLFRSNAVSEPHGLHQAGEREHSVFEGISHVRIVARNLAGLKRGRGGAFDDAAAETDLAVVYHHVLAGRDRALRRLEAHIDLAVIAMADPAGLVGLAIAHLCGERPVLRRRFVDRPGFHCSERGG